MSSQAAEKLPLWLRASIVAIGQLCAVVSILLIAVIAIYSWPSNHVSNDSVVDVGVPIAKIGLGQAIHFVAPPGTAFEMIDGAGSNHAGASASSGWLVHSSGGLIALAVNSSHLGCAVIFDVATASFEDPCGGSLFAIDGAVLHGPAMFPLSHVTWRQVGPTTIAVGQSRRTVHTDRGGSN
jgi:Rieske Fe-S protein